ncbi:hypothetical protein D6C91_10528 [Aureobasidium pullulans]|uniref:Uncharacterized protein n=1 Tax=Aureobasidium pullulans TaxID=5580 RepID=A0A4S9S541_AURPU|nr:hypothetical protein D6C91_10528 [Aureobasidium pullulans]
MKFNAKLGSFTNTVFGPVTLKEAILDNSIVIISANVSYAAPGLNSPSIAAITISINANATCYAAAIKTNSYRVEMITNKNIEKHIISLIKNG